MNRRSAIKAAVGFLAGLVSVKWRAPKPGPDFGVEPEDVWGVYQEAPVDGPALGDWQFYQVDSPP